MDKLQLTGRYLGRVFNTRSGCVCAMQLHCFETKLSSLMLKNRPKQLLGSLLLDIALPDSLHGEKKVPKGRLTALQLAYWLIALMAYCHTVSLPECPITVLVCGRTNSLLYWLNAILAHCHIGSFPYWLIGLLVHCHTGSSWLPHWLISIASLAHQLTGLQAYRLSGFQAYLSGINKRGINSWRQTQQVIKPKTF